VRARILPAVMLGVTAALTLSACTFSLSPQVRTVEGSDVAETAAGALEEQTGSRPDIDCGGDAIALEAGTKITCLLTDPASGLEYDVVVTITTVSRDGYEIDAKVADLPNNPPQPTAEPTVPGDVPSVTGDQIAALAVQALTPGLGFPPQLSCPEPEVQIVVGNTTYCQYDAEGVSHDVEVTITSFDPDAGTYRITAKVIS
jgi:hypothetical protein